MKRTSTSTRDIAKWTGGAAFGALAMFFSDPKRGRRRRALVRDRVQHLASQAADVGDAMTRDFGNRLSGLQAKFRRAMNPQGVTPDDRVIIAGVRAQLGRVVSHPHAVDVSCDSGHLILSGPVLTHEKSELLESIKTLPGITQIEDRLETHDSSSGIPALQGSGKSGRRSATQDGWTPALRGAAIASGAAFGAWGLRRKSLAGALLAAGGLGLLVRGVTNMSFTHLAHLRRPGQTIDLQKTIDISVLPETVFDIWTSYENFPYFMSHVLEARDLGDRRSHWIVQGPMGSRLEWTALMTEYTRPQKLAWQTEPGAAFEHSGSVNFEALEDNRTRVTVRMRYRPPAGTLGHALSVLLGGDPKRRLDDDLMRMKSFIESGIPPHDAAAGPAKAHSGVFH